MRIDLGSGKHKFRDCIGIDRIDYPDTDIVHDFNQKLPLEDNSVEFVMASHSLQYVDNLQPVMEDIYRVCRHKAIVCIVAPYAHVTSHIVNPQYKQLLNEHTPRYWTKHPTMTLDSDEFLFSPQDSWSLQDEESSLNIDFRVLHMEFFYFPPYRFGGYDQLELALLRQSQLNVAFQIKYQLLVVKEPIGDEEIVELNAASWFEEPDYVSVQRSNVIWKEEDEQPYYLDRMTSFLKDRNETDIRSAEKKQRTAKKQFRKPTPAKRSRFKHRMKTVQKKKRKSA